MMDPNVKKQRGVIVEDRISNLPQDILVHILSFLPTKDAVRTCVLSKSWVYLWTRVTRVDIIDKKLDRRERGRKRIIRRENLINFVNKVLHSNQTIQSFSLCLEDKCEDRMPHECPSFINCSFLVEFNLTICSNVTCPFSYCLPNLQFLTLGLITFIIPYFLNPKEVVYSFPALKVFEIRKCRWQPRDNNDNNIVDVEKQYKIINIVIDTPLLERFLLDNDPSLGMSSCTFEIFSANLKSVAHLGAPVKDIVVSSPLSVVDATIGIDDTPHGVLRRLSNLECLTLCSSQVLGLNRANAYIFTLPIFGRLVCLVLQSRDRFASKENLFNLLHKLPILEKLVFKCWFPYSDFGGKMQRMGCTSKKVPRCFLSSLKFVEIHFKYWHDHIYDAAKYMVANLEVLELLTFCPLDLMQRLEKDEFLRQLEELKKIVPIAATIKVDGSFMVKNTT